MQFTSTELPEVILIQSKIFDDERVFFLESYQKERFFAAGSRALLIYSMVIDDEELLTAHGLKKQ